MNFKKYKKGIQVSTQKYQFQLLEIKTSGKFWNDFFTEN
jgi:hypothetical protein